MNAFLCAALRAEAPDWSLGSEPAVAQQFLDSAAEHGLLPLVYEKMHRSAAWQTWPAMVKERLAIVRKEGIAIDLLRAHRVAELCESLEQNGVEYLLTKGEALAHTLYPEPGLRPRVDTDLLIRPDQIEPACTALERSGFEVIPPIFKTHQFMAVRSFDGFHLTVDVHWRILNSPRYARTFGYQELLAGSAAIPGIGNARTPGLVDTLVLACMHRAGSEWHDQQRLLWLYDAHLMMLRLDQGGWHELVSKAANKGVQSAVRDTLMLAVEKLASPVPAEFLAGLESGGEEYGLGHQLRNSYLALLVDDWKVLPGYRSRCRLLRELFIPGQAELEAEYGSRHRFVLRVLAVGYVLRKMLSRLGMK